MKSMTGYGKGVAEEGDRRVTIELKSVNNRYLEINTRLPKTLACCEEPIRKAIGGFLKRGSIDVFLSYENNSEDEKTVNADYSLIDKYIDIARRLKGKYGLTFDMTTSAVMRLPEAISIEAGDDSDIVLDLAYRATVSAAKELERMRLVEGETIAADLGKILCNIKCELNKIILRVPKMLDEYRAKLKARIADYLKEVEIDEARLVNEVAFFADKADINEEISRLNSHIAQFEKAVASAEPSGRKLDFISQEMNREINTMGSKSNDIEITNCVVAMKNELEKIKEQIRNVE